MLEPPEKGPQGPAPPRRPGRGKRRLCDPFRFDRGLLAEYGPSGQGTDLRLAGADEAGRGSLAGPLVAAAVVLDYAAAPFTALKGLTDSKLLSSEAREKMYQRVLFSATHVSWVAYCPGTIDRVGLHRCNLSALASVLESLESQYALAVVDGFDLERPDLQARSLVGADYKSAAVGAASIVAKVVRDRLMRTLAPLHPEYGFEEHVGYATERHRDALLRHGPCDLHRLSFRGVGTSQLGLWDE
jgi:ribonuclease HII